MESSRLSALLNYIQQNPEDPFNHYALALEYMKSDKAKALETFTMLMQKFPDYTATYYHAGQLLEELGEEEKALEVYEEGMKRTKGKDEKAYSELKFVYDMLV